MNQPFYVFPSIGYRNDDFQIVSNEKIRIDVFFNNQIVKTLETNPENPTIIRKLQDAGDYLVIGTLKDQIFQQKISVKDAYRLGSSEYKKAFVFEDSRYSFFLMKDRLFIYDEIKDILLTENHYSPTEIIRIDKDNYLFVTQIGDHINGIANFGVYNTNSFSLTGELLNDFQLIHISVDLNKLWVFKKSKSSIICFEIINKLGQVLIEQKQIENASEYFLDPDKSRLSINQEKKVILLDLYSLHRTIELEKTPFNAIDKYGYQLFWDEGKITCKNLLDNYSKEVSFSDKPALSDQSQLHIGEVFKNNNQFKDLSELGNKLLKRLSSSFPLDRHYFTHSLEEDEILIETFVQYQFFPTFNGLFVVRQEIKIEVNSFSFRKESDQWSAIPSINQSSTFSLTLFERNNYQTIIDSTTNLRIEKNLKYTLVVSDDSQVHFLKGNKAISFRKGVILKVYDFNDTIYLLLIEQGKFSLYDSSNLDFKLLDEVIIHNDEHLKEHQIIWYSGNKKIFDKDNYLNAFDLKSNSKLYLEEKRTGHSLFKDASDFEIFNNYILSSSKVVISPKNAEIKDAVLGKIEASSEDLNKIISMRENEVYFSKFNPLNQKFESTQIQLNLNQYKESYLSPNGKFLVLKGNTNEYLWYDIEKGEQLKFFSGKFLKFSIDGNLIIEKDYRRSIKIFDPLTFDDITPPNYQYYRFLSPDEKLYAEVSTNKRYTDRLTGKLISLNDIIPIKKEFDYPSITSFLYPNGGIDYIKEKEKIDENRRRFFILNKEKLERLEIKDSSRICSASLVQEELFTEIGIVGTDVKLEIHFPSDLQFYNYAAFSYDNKYFAYVGKPESRGIIHFFKIHFDEKENKLSILDTIDIRVPEKASWVCGFSKTGYFATYDSTPDTYILNAFHKLFDEKIDRNEFQENISFNSKYRYYSYKMLRFIPNKNFLCFSPSGNFLALSEQGYSPFTLGGYGHLESNAVHIVETETTKVVNSFVGHGDKLLTDRNKSLMFVAFSEDEKRIMSLSSDGVVIVRDLLL